MSLVVGAGPDWSVVEGVVKEAGTAVAKKDAEAVVALGPEFEAGGGVQGADYKVGGKADGEDCVTEVLEALLCVDGCLLGRCVISQGFF